LIPGLPKRNLGLAFAKAFNVSKPIKREMQEGAAPRAIRTPTSALRWRIEVAKTQYKPTPARSAAIVENTPISRSEKRVCAWA
jgi:hypothetical protein